VCVCLVVYIGPGAFNQRITTSSGAFRCSFKGVLTFTDVKVVCDPDLRIYTCFILALWDKARKNGTNWAWLNSGDLTWQWNNRVLSNRTWIIWHLRAQVCCPLLAVSGCIFMPRNDLEKQWATVGFESLAPHDKYTRFPCQYLSVQFPIHRPSSTQWNKMPLGFCHQHVFCSSL